MPKRDPATGRFMTEGYSIQLPSFITLIQILILSILIYPWYYIITKHNYLGMIFEYMFFRNVGDNVTLSGSNKKPY